MEQYIVVIKKKPDGETKAKVFGKEFKAKGKMVVNYYPPSNEQEGHYEIPPEIAHERGISLPVHSTGKNNCLYGGLAPLFNTQGKNLSAGDLRQIAETPNFVNSSYNILDSVTEFFNNPITKQFYYKVKSALLVGGVISDRKIAMEEEPTQLALGAIKKGLEIRRIGFIIDSQPECDYVQFFPLDHSLEAEKRLAGVETAYYAPYNPHKDLLRTWGGLQTNGHFLYVQ